MKIYCKWAFALMPLLLVGCKDEIDQPQGPVANSGDDVQFMIAADAQSRTVYSEPWAETGTNDIYWGNYVTTEKEYVNIYCPDNPSRGFARYEITARTEGDMSSAASISKTTTVGVQWGESGKPYTFYAFYPADKASTTLENGNTIRATVETGQNARSYKVRENTSTAAPAELASLSQYYTDEWSHYSESNQYVDAPAKTIFGMPDMRAAVMVANTTMPADKFGNDVPLDFKVLADVIDITLNGPVTPNTLGGNASGDEKGKQREYIRIQTVSLEVVNITGNDINGDPITDKTEIKNLPIDNDAHISGSFDLDMSKVPAITAAVAGGGDAQAAVAAAVTNVSGPASVQLQLGTSDGSAVSYPVLFTRPGGNVPAGQTADVNELDHLRLRAFIIPGQINSTNMNKLRVHIQTDCGDYYQMLQNDTQFVTGQIYPVKMGYFRQEGAEFDYSRWIGQLDPNIYITELSIPGAWHAANSLFQGSDVTMEQMYKAGIRAFEVHAKNGTEFVDPNDFSSSNFDPMSTTENFPDYFPGGTMTEERYASGINITNTEGWESTNISINGNNYNRRRSVTATATVTWLVPDDNTYQLLVPKFALRLYRSATGDSSDPLSTAIIDLAQNLRKDGLMFIEIGHESSVAVSSVPYRARVFNGKKYVRANITISGYEGGSTTLGIIVTPSGQYSWNLDAVDFTGIAPAAGLADGKALDDRSGTFNLSSGAAWAIAVRSCLERLQSVDNPSTGKKVLYSGPLTRFTTIRDVQGQIIAKVNTNGASDDDVLPTLAENEATYLWGSNTPALFSRWIDGSGDSPMTINLGWKQPVGPYNNSGQPDTPLRWCFTELENISNLTQRENAIKEMNAIAATNYGNRLHRTFYESSLGGYINGYASEANCQAVATALNPMALSLITNPTRQAVPLGLVFMNYVIPPSGQEDTYKSAELIKAIINNNRAFLLRRAGDDDTDTDVKQQTNSNYTSNPQNPLKP